MTLTAALFAALAVWLLIPAGRHARAHLVGAPSAVDADRWWSPSRWLGARRDAEQRRAREIAALTALSVELDAGQPATLALIAADPDRQVWPQAIAALAVDADVGAALRADGESRMFVRSLAACWTTSANTGAGLASAVASLAQAARSAEAMRGEIDVQLAGPRATARMLALLPLLGIAMGQLAGADPIGWLFTAPLGLVCLALGVVLNLAGLLWTRRIAAHVEAAV